MTDVELIKSKIDIVQFISDYIPLKKAGRNFKAICPFHSEKTPSFMVSPERQSWHCFGACSTGGDVVTFYQKWENIDFLEALKTLAEKTGIVLKKYTPAKDTLLKEKLLGINLLAGDYYHYLLTEHQIGSRARSYLEKRKINKDIIKNFMLGYAPASWDSLSRFFTKKNYSPFDLEAAGLLIKSEKGKYYDRFRGRLMFTLKDHRGRTVGFSGRLLPTGSASDANKPAAKYINTPETPVYIKGNCLYGLDVTRDSIKKNGFAVIVEGEFDFLSSYQAGITNIVAIKGTALTENQILLLKRFTDVVLLSLDSDIAGNEAAKRGIEIAENNGLTVKIVKLLKGKDPAECIEHGVHYWKKSVAGSVPVYDFIIDSAFNRYDANDITGKKKISDEVIPFIAKIQNPIVFSHYVKKMAKDLGVTEESIETAVDLVLKKKSPSKTLPVNGNVNKDRIELLEEHLLSLILQSKDVKEAFDSAVKVVRPDDFSIPVVKTIMSLLSDFLIAKDKFDINLFNKLITPEIAAVFDRIYMVDLGKFGSDLTLLKKELHKTSGEIKKASLRRTISLLSTQINTAEKEERFTDAQKLNRIVKDTIDQLKKFEI
ncbi:DNA primase [Candidatus Gottesmanbacteria bacterium RIFCSPHIGHO2_02_FULL_40_24]|uniref:DNA primase n=1 Tax=Candidatus Gottesmanbacteria bacterium RIFCSPHIGHO2_01_FULL_40_15 TaxID=1798376 RepID=A0A1F5Z1D8_9BACT|nr:MAG: DNA primase [Candidatus Gottesmanbacteria bacterium RIFCSPHIGHO2_01_FULL_40_15]OGG17884.1 MAG: DNA primase [Candidatus Gottesmanbacteria bacterium RIFCSPHIGHO2_02_FULL_40_24]OGG21751.1 MAG: DNA primase [Candidatus Gottesmanbacteria bacterium RIFCSPLOWO2_01_FULL_40_10]OGG24725.1 MAG: DNA primase [Candidatus Gottesmanbacteria bacterium RIFCSPHIGHO2_12_FULL_40_13]